MTDDNPLQESVQLGNLTPEQVADDSDEGKAFIQQFVRSRASRLDYDPDLYDVAISAEGAVTAHRKPGKDVPEVEVDMPDDDGENKHERDESDAGSDDDESIVDKLKNVWKSE
jgi:hypothetical protein